MKQLKMLGLAAVAAMAVMAVLGAGTASAKVCSKSGGDGACAAGHGNIYVGNFTATSETGTTATLVSGFVTVNCHSHVEGTLNGTTNTGTITSLTFSNCKSGSEPCTASTTASAANPWTAAVTTGTAPNGTMTTGTVTGEFECFGTRCKYHAATTGSKGEIVVNGGETATVKATKVPLAKEAVSGFLCSSTATWSGEYLVSTPDSLYLT
jgi:hypothetical protein